MHAPEAQAELRELAARPFEHLGVAIEADHLPVGADALEQRARVAAQPQCAVHIAATGAGRESVEGLVEQGGEVAGHQSSLEMTSRLSSA